MKLISHVFIGFLFISKWVYSETIKDPFQPPQFQPIALNETITEIENITPTSLNHQLIKLHSVDAATIADQLNYHRPSLLSEQAKITIAPQINSLIIKEKTENMPIILAWIKESDIPKQQVQITAHIISSSQEALQELGLDWGLSSKAVAGSPASKHLRYEGSAGKFVFNLIQIRQSLLSVKLNALEQKNLLSIIASPRLMASHEKSASIKQGTEIPYVTQDDKNKHDVQFKDAVLGMEVIPTIKSAGQIMLSLKISHNSPGTAISLGDNKFLAINKQEINTSVTINHGETLILGGIFQQKQEDRESSIPFLSDIPLVGRLFTHSDKHASRRELVIFITPRLVDI